MIGKIIINRGPAGPAGADGEQGLDGAPGAPGPAPSGTGFVKVSGGVLTTPSATIPIAEVSGLQPVLDGKASVINILNYGAVGDAKGATSASISSVSNTTTLTISTSQFISGDVGKYIRIEGAGAAGADLVGTIATFISGTQVTVSVAASTTVSAVMAVWGTNNTTAFASAVTAAIASRDSKIIFVPAGAFIGNFVLPDSGLSIHGASGFGQRIGTSVPSGGAFDSSSKSASVIIPAVRTASTIKCSGTVYGVQIENLTIFNGRTLANKLGIGIEVGNSPTGSAGYPGSAWVLRRLTIQGCAQAINVASAGDGQISQVDFAYSGTAINMDMLPDGSATGIADNLMIFNCTSLYADTILKSTGGKGTFLTSCDFNYPVTAFKLYDNAKLVVGNMNIEASGSFVSVADIYAGSRFIASHIQCLNAPKATLRIYNSENSPYVDIKSSSQVLFYLTTRAEYPAEISGGFVERYTDTTWTTRTRLESVVPIRAATNPNSIASPQTETWNRTAASPFGDWAFEVTNITNGAYAIRNSTASSNGVEFYTTNNVITNVGRFQPQKAQTWFPNFGVFQGQIKIPYGTNAKTRFGIYSRDASPTFTPVTGAGVRLDRSVPDANLQFELFSAGVPTVVDSGLAYGSMPALGVILNLTQTTTGVAFVLLNPSTLLPITPQVHIAGALQGNFVAACVLSGIAAADYAQTNCYPGWLQKPSFALTWVAP